MKSQIPGEAEMRVYRYKVITNELLFLCIISRRLQKISLWHAQNLHEIVESSFCLYDIVS